MAKKEYFILVNGEKVIVSREVYQAYWKHTNRENYLERLDRKNKLLFFSFLDEDGSFEESIEDKSIDVEKLVETKEAIEELHLALSKLNDEEREIIHRLYFDDRTLSEIADEKKVSYQAIQSRRNNILKKLKTFLEEII